MPDGQLGPSEFRLTSDGICDSRPTLTVVATQTHCERRQATRGTGRLLGRLAGPGPLVNGLDPGVQPGFAVRLACQLTYTQSEGCQRAPSWFSIYTNTCKHQSESCSSPRVISALRSRSSP
jgi:hypothetical protein